jgi:2-dehydro-3-deoxyphosphogluconate aldolase / (4S)-4-hydroxy-2-oxoglutarate aldolase
MEREQQIIRQIKAEGLLPLFYEDDSNVCLAVMNALYEAGVRCIEFTNRGPQALQNFTQLVKHRDEEMKDLLLATGTIKTGDQAKQFIDAGADFLISPFFDSAVCDEAYMQKICWIPGCMTPSEIHVAEQAGCKMIKLFPGNTIGPGFVEAILPLFPGLDFVVTGGVDTTKDNIAAWFKAGVAGVGMGSKLISKTLLQQKDYDGLKEKTKQVIAIIQQIKKAQ